MLAKDRLRQVRLQLSYTQEEFGRLLGIHQSLVNQYECGKKKPSLKTIRKICDKLSTEGIKIAYIDLNDSFHQPLE